MALVELPAFYHEEVNVTVRPHCFSRSGPKKNEIVNRQLCHFFRADIGLGMAIAQGLGVNVEQAMPKQHDKQPVTV